ncbi:MAG TPA: TonB-dependent receptor [Bryobacteraceae bacterium]|nr:TonB-dependent receptor [Bryobacteraceae bacterium]
MNEIHHFTPAFINDFRFNWQPRRFHNMSLGLGQGWPAKLGLRGVSERAFPRVNPAGYASLGPNTQERTQIPIHDTHLVDAAAWFRGKHSIRFGGEVRLARNVDDLDSQISGMLAFSPLSTALPGNASTGNALASLLLGVPNSGSIRDTDLLDRRAKYFALFVQEDWKATASLTVNLGARWETHTPRADASDRQNGFDAFAINPVSGTHGVVVFAGRNGAGRTLYNGDYNNIMPRLGLAWKPSRLTRTVIRSAYGIFYGPPQPGSNTASAGFETSGSFASPDNGITPPFLLREGFPSTMRAEPGPGFGAVRAGERVVFSPEFIGRDRALGYSQQWNFGVQHEPGWDTVVEVTYLGNVGHKLNGPDTSINQVPHDRMGPGNAQVRRPFPQFGNVTLIAPMWGNSSYHALNLKLEKRFSHGLNLLGNYTFSKFIDDVTASQEAGTVGGGTQDLYNRRAEKALSGNDVRHRFVWSSVYELPIGKGRRWLSQGIAAFLGGWNVGAILIRQSGSPVGLVTQQNTTNAFNPGSQRVNVLRDPALPASERTIARWFDTSAVVAPPPNTFGNAGRALLTGPGLFNLDSSLLKNHRFGETYNVQFRFEAFNVLNHANFEEPGRALGAPGFGVINDARPGRSLQFGLKFAF